MAAGKRPVPFRTRLAKPARADGTAPGRVWESRLPPAYNFMVVDVIPGVGATSTTFFVFACAHCSGRGVCGGVRQIPVRCSCVLGMHLVVVCATPGCGVCGTGGGDKPRLTVRGCGV